MLLNFDRFEARAVDMDVQSAEMELLSAPGAMKLIRDRVRRVQVDVCTALYKAAFHLDTMHPQARGCKTENQKFGRREGT